LHWTTHVVTGAAVGYIIGRPVPAALVGFASHIALDTFPHNDPESDVPYVVDSMIGLACLGVLAGNRRLRRVDKRWSALAGAVGAAAPDLELLRKLVSTVHEEDYLYPTHNGTIPHRQTTAVISYVTQAGLIALTVGSAILKWRLRRASGTAARAG